MYVGLLDDGSLMYVVGTPEELTGGVLLDVGREVSREFGIDGSTGCDIELAFV